MTIQEMGAIMDVLTVAYPMYYSKVGEDEKFKASCLWAEMFSDDPVDIVVAAVKKIIVTNDSNFPPSIGTVKSKLLEITEGDQKSALEAWADVKKALSKAIYNSVEEFDRLDAVSKRVVGSHLQLAEWAKMETGTLDSVIGSNFRESYKAASRSRREYASLPGPVADLVNQLAAAKDLNSESEKPKEPKALPVSVRATVEELSRASGVSLTSDIPKPLSKEEFKRKKAEMLRELGVGQ